MRTLAQYRGRRVHRLDLVNLTTERALREMRRGAVLYLSHTKNGPRWSLSNGQQLSPEVARAAATNPEIVAADRGLFAGADGQSWRQRNKSENSQ
jgi:hypothetical protein